MRFLQVIKLSLFLCCWLVLINEHGRVTLSQTKVSPPPPHQSGKQNRVATASDFSLLSYF